ncbi:hypothetical protein PN498_24935 [Oscillatoria sp. CS-180]|uniref:hypothetical protein n=1 Tax=Oscillatoria sp. CS-180 TaxID=3021720 RepID=UPI0023309ACD|nr:hypothetical protein [Oscillatoria sp. CS-180]MDB9529262.1 hypothetical protein [Oscillatoria sp. CS-180]
MFGILASVLVAQVSTTDWVCWMDMGYGPVDMSNICGISANAEASSNQSEETTAESNTQNEPAFAYGTFIPLPGVWECAEARSDQVINSAAQTYEVGMFERFLDQCAAELGVIATFNSPSGRLEIVEPIRNEGFWVRVPDDREGYGPFERRSEAQEWAKENFVQFF